MNSTEIPQDPSDRLGISVVIPYFNDSETIARALESVNNQTMQPLETLVVDDASQPDEFEKMCSIVRQFPHLNIRVIRQALNQGPSAARNVAWDSACGSYIAFLDADDAWHPGKLALQLNLMEKDPALCIIGTRAKLGGGSPEKIHRSVEDLKVTPRAQLLRNRFVTSSVLIRSDVDLRFREDLRYSEDNDLWSRVLLHGQNRGTVLQASLSFQFKPPLSRLGASGHFWRMYRGQLQVYTSLRHEGLLSITTLLLCLSSCTLRFAVRMMRFTWSTLGRLVAGGRRYLAGAVNRATRTAR